MVNTIYLKLISIFALTQENLSSGGLGTNKGVDQPEDTQSDQPLCYLLIGKYHIKT